MPEHTFANASAPGRTLTDLEGPGLKQWQQRSHLLDTDDLTLEELNTLLEAARICSSLISKQEPPLSLLNYSTVANLFYENSTRTRSSFELAARRLGATVLNLDIASSSVAKGETIADTAKTLLAMGVNAIVQRHSASGSAAQVAEIIGNSLKIINAGDGWHAHPTQALLDYFTISQISPKIKGLKIAIIGDITHSRVARSNIRLLSKLGAVIDVAGPPTLLPSELSAMGVKVHDRLEPAIEGADFVMTLRLQLERQQDGLIPSLSEYRKLYRLDSTKMALAAPQAYVMHPGPINRDLEISHELANDQKRSLVSTQVANGVAVRMAILYLLLSGKGKN
ncbi:MAG: aspartate carbamoyltransferase catalytic subunit [Candidatus Obscuribacterales bacterium]|nr:aspartate carbamoyltransferase catalytic subunit [Candidatus Obscuribacterales bacterium]